MPFIADYVLDGAVAKIIEGSRVDVCTSEPATYTAATSTNSLGNKTGITAGAASDRTPNGRKSTIPAIVSGAPGTVTASGTATSWSWSDVSNSRLLSAGALGSSQALVSGNTFTLAAIDVGFSDAA